MKAPRSIDRYLRAQRFGYGKPYYQRWCSKAPLVEALLFGRQSSGVLIHLKAIYPAIGGGLQISPLEIEVLYQDGRIDGLPASRDPDAYWSDPAWGGFPAAFESAVQRHFDRLADAQLMTATYEYLIGNRAPAPPFPAIDHEWITRKPTPLRTSCLAAYLNLAGRFDEALQTIETVPRPTPFDEKIAHDARAGRIGHIDDVDAYLRQIGAKQ